MSGRAAEVPFLTTSVALLALVLVGCGGRSRGAEIRFVEAAVASGLDYRGATYAVAAADVDGDGWSDLAVSNHGSVRLYRNLADGRFMDITTPELARSGDTHGISWLDFDDDGCWDLFVAIGAARGRGVGANRAYVNVGGRLSAASKLDAILKDPLGRGRCAIPADVDRDGRLDLALLNAYQPDRGQRLARRADHGFIDIAPETGWREIPWECGVVLHVDDSNEPLYVASVSSGGQPTAFRYDNAVGVFKDMTREVGLVVDEPISAVAPGDFDNDGDLDLYVVTGGGVPEDVAVTANGLAFRMISHPPGVLKGFRFTADGWLKPTILLEGRADPERVLLGRDRVPLARTSWSGDPRSPLLDGRPEVNPERDRAVFLWRDEAGVLTLWFAGHPSDLWETSGWIESSSGIRLLERRGLTSRRDGPRNHLFENRHGRFVEITEIAGVGGTGSAVDAVFADVDNDGDLDLFVVNGREAFSNPSDTLYRNNGDRTFADVSAHAGLAGAVAGRGDGVVAFDPDRDGDIDLFVTNGRGPPPENAGPYQLWRNVSSLAGSSVVVHAVGRAGNRPAFGTRVTAHFGRHALRLERFASSGRFATSIHPFHIGLGGETDVVLKVVWPSGTQQEVVAKAGDELVLREPGGDPGAVVGQSGAP